MPGRVVLHFGEVRTEEAGRPGRRQMVAIGGKRFK